MSVNKVILVGRVGKDAEHRSTESGEVSWFSMATTERYKNKSGELVEDTEWHRVVVWGKQAETIAKYVKKGILIYVSGRKKTREYEDNNGIKKTSCEIISNEFRFLSGKCDEQQTQPKEKTQENSYKSDIDNNQDDGDDLPF